ncbi:uncharacterized protein [Typha angustifolia]|uniref:uncharacterized protein isoform X1 n=1 Tax=Typha angustifolia TaxID=59011 RepID=UPI003C2BC022
MEGVGARLGRSSTRFCPTAVFTGPVRKWKKRWVPFSNPNPNSTTTNNAKTNNNSNNRSNLLIYKWTPTNGSASEGLNSEELHVRTCRYVPVSVIEDQKQVATAKSGDDNKPGDAKPSLPKTEPFNQKIDMNDVPMQESQASEMIQVLDKDGNGTDLNLNLDLEDADNDNESVANMG